METQQNREEIGFLRIDGVRPGWYNGFRKSKTLMTDG